MPRRYSAWLIILLILSGNIELNPGPALQLCRQQLDCHSILQHCDNVLIASDGHCLPHAVSISFRNYLSTNIHVNDIIKFVRSELSVNINEYSTYLNVSSTDYFEQL